MEINRATYLKYLKMADSGDLLPTNRLAGIELRLVEELIVEGLLSDSKERFLSTVETNKTIITPKGAVTLSDWERDEKENKWWYKFGSALTRALWILVGAIAAVVPSWFIT